jgi:hypothetical protein
MKIHIVSLQRTGSKSLEKAIAKKYAATALGEFLHGWEQHGYKFGASAERPFDPNAPIWFHTHPDFHSIGEFKNFEPKVDRSGEFEGVLTYTPCSYWSDSILALVGSRISVLNELFSCENFERVVVKTQLVYLLEQVPELYRSDLCRKLKGLFDFSVGIYPSDVRRWVWSNLLADHTGIFVPGTDMEAAIETLRRQQIHIPVSSVRPLLTRLKIHKQLMTSCDLVVRTEAINDLGLIFDLPVPADREFSAASPEELPRKFST